MNTPPRRGTPADLPLLLGLEEACYDPPRRSSPASLRRSLHSPHQEVWLHGDVGALILWRRPRTWRVHGLHTHPGARGQGIAGALLAHAEARARAAGAARVVLEADADDARLVAWYGARSYRVTRRLPDYYAPGRSAVRMVKSLSGDG